MKYEWRKREKNLYMPEAEPVIVDVPVLKYITIAGEGSPYSDGFSQSVGALYALSYGIKMAPRSGLTIDGYFEYTVYPLEGIWDLTDEGRKKYRVDPDITKLKDDLCYTLMIRQPEFVSAELFKSIKQAVFAKKKNDSVLDTKLETLHEGLSCQILHIGSYDSEPASFAKMEEYCRHNKYARILQSHREIYLSDPTKVTASKLRTTLRFRVEKQEVNPISA